MSLKYLDTLSPLEQALWLYIERSSCVSWHRIQAYAELHTGEQVDEALDSLVRRGFIYLDTKRQGYCVLHPS